MTFTVCGKNEDLNGLWVDENHIAIRHHSGVCFSFARRGNAVMLHFSSTKKAMRHVKGAINELCDWVFDSMPWATMTMACISVNRQSVARLVLKCGFEHLIDHDGHTIYIRVRK